MKTSSRLLPLLLLLCLCAPAAAADLAAPAEDAPAEFSPDDERLQGPPAPSKKERLIAEKGRRRALSRRLRRVKPPPLALSTLTLRNQWTTEVLPLWEGAAPLPQTWSRFLRCHHTNQSIPMDLRLLALIRAAAAHFESRFVEIVSGFRAPKYNLSLRKKGRQVARDSQHTHGNAVDFRLAGVAVTDLRQFVRQRRLGGVGYYPKSQFIHADTGPIRTWTAE